MTYFIGIFSLLWWSGTKSDLRYAYTCVYVYKSLSVYYSLLVFLAPELELLVYSSYI